MSERIKYTEKLLVTAAYLKELSPKATWKTVARILKINDAHSLADAVRLRKKRGRKGRWETLQHQRAELQLATVDGRRIADVARTRNVSHRVISRTALNMGLTKDVRRERQKTMPETRDLLVRLTALNQKSRPAGKRFAYSDELLTLVDRIKSRAPEIRYADLGELLGCPPRSLETALVEYRKRRA
jgi:hypothetical protein